MARYQPNQRVRITGGSYKDSLFGTFLGYYGNEKACVKVDALSQRDRNLNLTSIRPVCARDEKLHGYERVHGTATTATTADFEEINLQDIKMTGRWKGSNYKYVKVDTEDLLDLLDEFEAMSVHAKDLEEQLKQSKL